MPAVSLKLSLDLKTELKKANEVWIAVGLLNNKGLEFILQNTSKTCKLNFVVGIDLPTDPKALLKLLALKRSRQITAQILTKRFFHPKVYITKSTKGLTAFVGSANCTMGGLEGNIEMSLVNKNISTCNSLVKWFETDLLPNSFYLTADFIKDYKPKYDNRIKRRKKEKQEIDELKEKEKNKLEANIKSRSRFISKLKRIRNSKYFEENKKNRQAVVRNLRRSLDYPNFKNFDLNSFFAIRELGTIDRRMVKSKILENRKKFTSLMKLICDENLPIEKRFNEGLYGHLSIKNISKGFISKVLVIHNSKNYYLHNDIFTERLRPFGLVLPRGLSFGEKYELTRNILKGIMKEANIDDFAILDQCIWMIE